MNLVYFRWYVSQELGVKIEKASDFIIKWVLVVLLEIRNIEIKVNQVETKSNITSRSGWII